jgi:hypothetical protein
VSPHLDGASREPRRAVLRCVDAATVRRVVSDKTVFQRTPPLGFLILSVVLASAIPTAETTVGSDTFQITVEDGITIAAPRKTSRAINRREASDYGEPTRTTRMRMSEPAGAGSPIPAEVIPQLAAAAAQIAAACEEPAPATITAAPATRAKALEVLFKGSTVPASHDATS